MRRARWWFRARLVGPARSWLRWTVINSLMRLGRAFTDAGLAVLDSRWLL